MIPYIEVLDKKLNKTALVEPTEWFGEISYYEVGECELYCRASETNLDNLELGYYLKMPNNKYLWVITSIQYEFNSEGARMISAKGKEAKYILNKRCILTPVQLPNTLGGAIGNLLQENIVKEGDRKIDLFEYGILDTTPISDIQATRENLLDFILTLSKTYNKGVQVIFENNALHFRILSGNDKSKSVVFAQSMDNLLSSTYFISDENERTYSKIVSNVEDIDYIEEYDKGQTGIERSEKVINSNLSTEYTPNGSTETVKLDLINKPIDKLLYLKWLKQEAKNDLSTHTKTEEVSGEIDMTNSIYEFDNHYALGDLVKVKDEYFKYEFETRILKFVFKQDTKGYSESIDYGRD